jgi:hypothetical protein
MNNIDRVVEEFVNEVAGVEVSDKEIDQAVRYGEADGAILAYNMYDAKEGEELIKKDAGNRNSPNYIKFLKKRGKEIIAKIRSHKEWEAEHTAKKEREKNREPGKINFMFKATIKPGKYVVMTYAEEQNAPSKPERKLVSLSKNADIEQWPWLLKYCKDNEVGEVMVNKADDFGDYDIDLADGLHVLITRVEG